MWRKIGVSTLKIFAFLGLWACLTAACVGVILAIGGEQFYDKVPLRVALEVMLTFATLIPAVVLARFLDKRGLASIGLSAARLFDLLIGAVIGGAILMIPICALLAIGAARFEPDIGAMTLNAIALGMFVCLFNVTTQELMVRSYMFQELWAKFGAWVATIVTTIFFVAVHANAIMQGAQGLVAGANILLASLLLSLAYVRTGQLWLAIGIHLGWNGLQGPVLGINVTGHDLGFGHWRVFEFGGDPLLTGGAMGVEGGLIGLLGPAAGIAIVALLFKQQPKPDFSARRSRQDVQMVA